ncbi:unnamed protein product [Penicillium olsonii]|nr:unnamed protein product [Penicillium olsonii]CAG7923522.1 unnamed protein product [Penicillium olsonii]
MNWLFSWIYDFLWPPGPWSPYSKTRPKIRFSEKDETETRLEESGDLNTLQRLRYQKYRDETNSWEKTMRALLSTEELIRHASQHEECLNQFLRQCLDGSDKDKAITELTETRRLLWNLTRLWWLRRNVLGEGVVARALNLWRSNSMWYMHEVLVEDCARKDGCCSRGCGCCAKRHQTFTRPLTAGHCSIRCRCCISWRGFYLDREEENDIYDEFQTREGLPSYDQIELASIWGLRLNCHKSPFNLLNRDVSSLAKKTQVTSYAAPIPMTTGMTVLRRQIRDLYQPVGYWHQVNYATICFK